MRKIIFIALSIFLCSNSFGQAKKDSTMIQFIKCQKDFVALSDTANLPKEIQPYYESILDYLSKNNLNKNDYYVWTSFIEYGTDTIFIPIYHYDGFIKKKELEDKDRELNKNRKKDDPIFVTDMNGNATGKDGNLEIDKRTKKVTSFKLWQ